jgi:hypothetical protein
MEGFGNRHLSSLDSRPQQAVHPVLDRRGDERRGVVDGPDRAAGGEVDEGGMWAGHDVYGIGRFCRD